MWICIARNHVYTSNALGTLIMFQRPTSRRHVGACPTATPCIAMHSLYVLRMNTRAVITGNVLALSTKKSIRKWTCGSCEVVTPENIISKLCTRNYGQAWSYIAGKFCFQSVQWARWTMENVGCGFSNRSLDIFNENTTLRLTHAQGCEEVIASQPFYTLKPEKYF